MLVLNNIFIIRESSVGQQNFRKLTMTAVGEPSGGGQEQRSWSMVVQQNWREVAKLGMWSQQAY